MDRPPPLYVKVARRLLADIGRGRLRPGDRVPTEEALGASFKVSRITVRQALEILRQRGLVERTAGRGSFVTSAPGAYVLSLGSVEDVVQAGGDSDVEILEWTAARPGPDVDRKLRLSGRRAYVLRTLRRRQGSPLCYSETYTRFDIGRRLDRAALYRRTVIETIEGKLGLRVARAIEEISAGAADRELARRLDVARGSPVVIVEMTFVDVDERPIEYVRTSYRADRFKRRNELRRLRNVEGAP